MAQGPCTFRPGIDRLAAYLLGSHVIGSADGFTLRQAALVVHQPHVAEVGDLQGANGRSSLPGHALQEQQNIAGFEIAMQDSIAVSNHHRFGELQQPFSCLARCGQAGTASSGLQRSTRNVFHHVVETAAALVTIVNLDESRVPLPPQLGDRFDFPAETSRRTE